MRWKRRVWRYRWQKSIPNSSFSCYQTRY